MFSPWSSALLSNAAAPLQVCFSSTLQEVELYRHVGIGTATHGETDPAQPPRLVNQWHRWGPSANKPSPCSGCRHQGVLWLPCWCLWRELVPVPAYMQHLQ